MVTLRENNRVEYAQARDPDGMMIETEHVEIVRLELPVEALGCDMVVLDVADNGSIMRAPMAFACQLILVTPDQVLRLAYAHYVAAGNSSVALQSPWS